MFCFYNCNACKITHAHVEEFEHFFFYVIKIIYKREFALNLVQCLIIEHVAWAFIFGLSTSRGGITSVLFDCSPHLQLVLILFGNAFIIRPGKNLLCIWRSNLLQFFSSCVTKSFGMCIYFFSNFWIFTIFWYTAFIFLEREREEGKREREREMRRERKRECVYVWIMHFPVFPFSRMNIVRNCVKYWLELFSSLYVIVSIMIA